MMQTDMTFLSGLGDTHNTNVWELGVDRAKAASTGR